MRIFVLTCLLLIGNFSCVFSFIFGSGSDAESETMLQKAQENFASGECAKTVEIILALLDKKPPSALKIQAYKYLGQCYERLNLTDRALGVYQLANTLCPDNEVFLLSLAKLYYSAGFFEKSKDLFHALLALNPENLEANIGLARAYAFLGFLSRAKEFYGASVKLTGYKDKSLLKEYSLCLLKQRDFDGVIRQMKTLQIMDPDDGDIYLIFSRAYIDSGNYEKALDYLTLGESIAGDKRRIRLSKALIWHLLGNREKCLAETNKILKENPADNSVLFVKYLAGFEKRKAKPEAEVLNKILENATPFVAEMIERLKK
ncbi:MAG: tetratricopeptide repeat protein [Elusimicrobia bacterium]|nr:tetratricopeptide repeat protein [Elusimicrobiota bacterium]